MVVSKIPASPPTDLWDKVRSSVQLALEDNLAPYFLSSVSSSAPTASILMSTGPFSTEDTLVDEETGAFPAISRPSLFFLCAAHMRASW